MADSIGSPNRRSFPRTAGCLPEIFDFMDAFFRDENISGDIRLQMHFAIEELFTNMVKYGRGGTKNIVLELERDGGRLILSLTDFGVERFDIRDMPDVNVELELKDRKPGGLGIHLLKRMVDEVGYEYVDGRSTTTLIKALE